MPSEPRRRLTAHLKAMLASRNYQPGDKLPPLRELAEYFHTTLSTARNAVLELQQLGLLEIRRSDGIYVLHTGETTGAHTAGRRITVVYDRQYSNLEWDWENTFCAHALLGLQDLAARDHFRIDLLCKYYYKEDRIEITPEDVRGSDAIVFLGAYDWAPLTLPPELPAVGVSMALPGNRQFSTVGIDPFHAAVLAREYFRERGFRRVRCIYFDFGAARLLFEAFHNEFNRHGVCEGIPVPDNHPSPAIFDDPDCGYFFCNGTVCELAQREYRQKHGRELCRERTLLSCDGKSRYVQGYTPVPNLGIDWRDAGKAAFTECRRRIDHPELPPRNICLMPDLQLP